MLATDPSRTHPAIPSAARADRQAMTPLGAIPDRRSVRRLRVSAAAVARILARGASCPSAWMDVRLGVDVDRVRHQLLPIGSLAALAASWSREHAVHTAVAARGRVPCAVRLAYAVRWLELSGVIDERPWALLVRGSGR